MSLFITDQQDVNDADADEQGDKAEEEEEEEEEEEVIICFHFITTTVSVADCWIKRRHVIEVADSDLQVEGRGWVLV